MDENTQLPDLLVAALQQCHDPVVLFTEFNVLGPMIVAQKYHLMVNDSYVEFATQFMEFWDATYGPFFSKPLDK